MNSKLIIFFIVFVNSLKIFSNTLLSKEYQFRDSIISETVVANSFTTFPVTMCLYTIEEPHKAIHQYVCFYDDKHEMYIAQREKPYDNHGYSKCFSAFKYYKLNSKIGYDSHNYITMCVDNDGYIHCIGNMHSDTLKYWKSLKPWDCSSLQVSFIDKLKGELVTYPCFIKNQLNGELMFLCRTGYSGAGDEILFKYKNNTWILDRIIFKGNNESVYILGIAGDIGFNAYNPYTKYYELLYLWRESPNAETCKNLSFMRTKDFVSFENYKGENSTLNITSNDIQYTIDKIPIKCGLLNTMWKMLYTEHGTFIAYHKYDENKNSQIYIIGIINNKLLGPVKITDWKGRLEFGGMGSGPSIAGFVNIEMGKELYEGTKAFWIQCSSSFEKSKRFYYSEESFRFLGVTIPQLDKDLSLHMKGEKKQLITHIIKDLNSEHYFLRYKTLEPNRDKKRSNYVDIKTKIEVIEIK